MTTTLIEFREHIDLQRDAAILALDESLSEEDRVHAAKIAKAYAVILSEHALAFLDEFDHSIAAMH
jgi:hypothetical protein